MKYRAFVDGKELVVNEARVSKMPFNMVWKGYQRDMSQTEIAGFVSFDMDRAVVLEIEVIEADIKTVAIRPLEFGLEYNVSGNKITVKLNSPKKFTVEVNGWHEALHVFANEPDTFVPDENTLYFGPGVHDAGMIYPKSGQTVYIAEGAVVYGGVYAYKADNVKICGRGVLDSSKILRGDELTASDELYKELSKIGLTHRDITLVSGFTAYECNNFTVEGIVLRDAPFWSMIIRNGSRDVVINNVKIVGQWRYNADGIDLCASGNITLTDCFVRSFDDSIVIRAVDLDGETTPCDNIKVENNVLWCDWGKNLEIWCGDKNAVVKDVVFRNNYLIHCTDTGISIDTWYGAPSLLVDNVLYENIYIDTDAVPMLPVIQNDREHKYPEYDKLPYDIRHAVSVRVGKSGKNLGNQGCDSSYDCTGYNIIYKNVAFKNVVCNSDLHLPVRVNSTHMAELSNVTFENCVLGRMTFN